MNLFETGEKLARGSDKNTSVKYLSNFVLMEQQIDFLSEMVQKCPDGPKGAPNCQKHPGFRFRTLLDLFGPLWNVDKPAMFGHFCLFYWCVFFWDTLYFWNTISEVS